MTCRLFGSNYCLPIAYRNLLSKYDNDDTRSKKVILLCLTIIEVFMEFQKWLIIVSV